MSRLPAIKINRDFCWPLLIVGVIFLVSGQSEVATPGLTFRNIDKIAHFGVFGALATSLIRLEFFRNQGWKGALQVCLLVSLFGGLDEWRQSFTPGRAVEFFADGRLLGSLQRTYADAAEGEPVVYVNSFGRVEVAVRGGSAAERLPLRPGAAIVMKTAGRREE